MAYRISYEMFARVALAVLVSVLAVVVPSKHAAACAVAIPHPSRMPLCDVPLATSDEKVFALRVEQGGTLSTFVLPANRRSRFENVTRILDVVIEPGVAKRYISISSGGSIIWRFSGDVGAVSRLVVFGSDIVGPKHVGIVGVAKERIYFPTTSDQALVTEPTIMSACGFELKACHPGHYLYRYPDPVRPGMSLIKQFGLRDQWNAPAETFIAPDAGMLTADQLEEPASAYLKGQVAALRVNDGVERMSMSGTQDGRIDPQDVISPD